MTMLNHWYYRCADRKTGDGTTFPITCPKCRRDMAPKDLCPDCGGWTTHLDRRLPGTGCRCIAERVVAEYAEQAQLCWQAPREDGPSLMSEAVARLMRTPAPEGWLQ